VNIPDQFPQTGLFLAHNRFVAILKQLATSDMPPVKSNNITGKEASHHRGKRANSRPKQKMGVVLTPFYSIALIKQPPPPPVVEGCFDIRIIAFPKPVSVSPTATKVSFPQDTF